MIIVRSCGSGMDYKNERLKLLRTNVEYMIDYASAKIFKLYDHKGDLSVYWFSTPTKSEIETLNDLWALLEPSEVIHYEITILDKVIRL
jgi:hypothetical protein